MKYLFIDESKAKDFLLCVVEIDSKEIPHARKVVESVRKKGQSTVHFVKESEQCKKKILSEIASIEFTCKMYLVKGMSQSKARELAISSLVEELEFGSHYFLCLDRDENHESQDRKVIADVLIKRGLSKLVNYTHEEPRYEKLLSLPDAIAWSRARGGDWKRRVSSFCASVVKIEK